MVADSFLAWRDGCAVSAIRAGPAEVVNEPGDDIADRGVPGERNQLQLPVDTCVDLDTGHSNASLQGGW
jgi:hypothetical protein